MSVKQKVVRGKPSQDVLRGVSLADILKLNFYFFLFFFIYLFFLINFLVSSCLLSSAFLYLQCWYVCLL